MEPIQKIQRDCGGVVSPASAFPRFLHFGHWQKEYLAAIQKAALFDLTGLGLLRIRGKDALDLLHRLTMNEIRNLNAGEAVVNAFADAKGKIRDAVVMIRRLEGLHLLTGCYRAAAVAEWIDRYTFVEEIEVRDETDPIVPFLLTGPEAEARFFPSGPAFRLQPVSLAGRDVEAMRLAHWLPRGLLMLVQAKDAEAVLQSLLSGDAGMEPRLAGAMAFHALRVAQGVPLAGAEIDGKSNPYECGLSPFISFTKGCYTGQEVIARLDTYDKVKQQFVGVWLENDSPPQNLPRPIVDEKGREAGQLTSAAFLPDEQRVAGLARIRRAALESGARLHLSGNGTEAVVTLRSLAE